MVAWSRGGSRRATRQCRRRHLLIRRVYSGKFRTALSAEGIFFCNAISRITVTEHVPTRATKQQDARSVAGYFRAGQQ
jgi:hypothetical protein